VRKGGQRCGEVERGYITEQRVSDDEISDEISDEITN
jgi:hypothetical protein